jgi:hypothetical protein
MNIASKLTNIYSSVISTLLDSGIEEYKSTEEFTLFSYSDI